jgi:hypothetical protein
VLSTGGWERGWLVMKANGLRSRAFETCAVHLRCIQILSLSTPIIIAQ